MRAFGKGLAGVFVLLALQAAALGEVLSASDLAPTPLKSISANELRTMLEDPTLSVNDRVALLRDSAERPLEPEAVDIAKAGLRTSDPRVMHFLTYMLREAGKEADVVAILGGMLMHPQPPYDSWVGALGIMRILPSAGKRYGRMQLCQTALTVVVQSLRKANVEDQQQFLRAFCASDVGRFALTLTRCRAMEHFLADMLKNEAGETVGLALRVLSQDTKLYYFPAGGISELIRIAEDGDTEDVALASAILRTVIGADKPGDRSWREWGEMYATGCALFQMSLARASDKKERQAIRGFAIPQALSLSADLGAEEFSYCAGHLLRLAQDEGETPTFRASVVSEVCSALEYMEMPFVRTRAKALLLSWTKGQSSELKRLSINRLATVPGATADREITDRLKSVLGNTDESHRVRAAAAFALHFLDVTADTELARSVLGILKETEQIPAEAQTSSQLRGLLWEITGLPSDSPIATWESELDN